MGHTGTMEDLHVSPGPGAPHGLRIPAAELTERFSHSSGPGGQAVNTSDSRVQLSFNISTTTALTPVQRTRALQVLAPKLASGVLTVSSSEERSQFRNRKAVRERLTLILREAVVPPVPRRPTKPSKASLRRRQENKIRRSEIKRNRRRPEAHS